MNLREPIGYREGKQVDLILKFKLMDAYERRVAGGAIEYYILNFPYNDELRIRKPDIIRVASVSRSGAITLWHRHMIDGMFATLGLQRDGEWVRYKLLTNKDEIHYDSFD